MPGRGGEYKVVEAGEVRGRVDSCERYILYIAVRWSSS